MEWWYWEGVLRVVAFALFILAIVVAWYARKEGVGFLRALGILVLSGLLIIVLGAGWITGGVAWIPLLFLIPVVLATLGVVDLIARWIFPQGYRKFWHARFEPQYLPKDCDCASCEERRGR